MKRAWIFKLVAIVLSVLVVVILSMILFQNQVADIFEPEGNGEMKFSYEHELEVNNLTSLMVDWKNGNITLVPSAEAMQTVEEGEERPEFTIRVLEQSAEALSVEDQAELKIKGGELQIDWKKKSSWLPFLNFDLKFRPKSLQIEIPQEIYNQMEEIRCENASGNLVAYDISPQKLVLRSVSGEVQAERIRSEEQLLSTVSGAIRAQGLTTQQMEISSVSGAISATELVVQQLKSDGVSSNILVEGALTGMEISTVSGEVIVRSSICPDQAALGSVSGDLSMRIPQNSEFTVAYDSISGRFNSRFDGRLHDKELVVGSGRAEFQMNTTSGDMTIDPIEE